MTRSAGETAPGPPPCRAASARACSAFALASWAAFTAARSTTPLMDMFRGCMRLSSPVHARV